MTGLVDFHCHLDLFPSYATEFENCDREAIETLAVTTTPRAWARNRELAAKGSHVRPALGLHPQLVADHSDEMSIWEDLVSQARFIGEIGIDARAENVNSLDLQTTLFQRMLQRCSELGGRILSVHSTRATGRVLDLIERWLPAERGRTVLHWFTGTSNDATRAIRLGCFFSINSAMLGSARIKDIVSALPIERLLTETDGPFTKTQGRPSAPKDVGETLRLLSNLRGIPVDEVRSHILENVKLLDATS